MNVTNEAINTVDWNKEDWEDTILIAIILSDNYMKPLYELSDNIGYFTCMDILSGWAKEFHETYKDFDWENMAEGGDHEEFPDCDCWDSAVIEWGEARLEKYKKDNYYEEELQPEPPPRYQTQESPLHVWVLTQDTVFDGWVADKNENDEIVLYTEEEADLQIADMLEVMDDDGYFKVHMDEYLENRKFFYPTGICGIIPEKQ